eukprot:TRINITY_DN10146_c0_g1_i2.p4 TRINITY_DN10146_c0_g1~~TRINITY_DN10146_c0_g1_i2.p4  ORF type:complete len:101 (-),score=22.96 TRINITY_DN10146_c0_g1_i2:1008-1310(-)
MYKLLTGEHPLYQAGESLKDYIAKLRKPQWKFPETFYELPKSLFLKLMKVRPFERYTAKEALEHPWITRMPEKAPLNYPEAVSWNCSKSKLINARNLNNS